MRRSLLCLLALAACAPTQPTERDPAFDAQAIAFLDALQPQSIREGREYCGYFGVDETGAFRATKARVGWEEGCELTGRPQHYEVIASYHTHASFDAQIDSEVPSTDDVESDIRQRTNGYISTPGGRVWLVDWRTGIATQLCGIGCVTRDPNFVRGAAGPISVSYDLRTLRRREMRQ